MQKSRTEYKKKWYQTNKVTQKIKNRQYYENNKESILRQAWEYRRTFSSRYHAAKCTAAKRKILFKLSIEEYVSMLSDGTCHYCGNRLHATSGGLDRKNNERFYGIENSVPCCKRCKILFHVVSDAIQLSWIITLMTRSYCLQKSLSELTKIAKKEASNANDVYD